MKISFLVTYYNQRSYVKQSLESILAIEKTCDWEILVGDDGSTDGTLDVINEFVKSFPNNIFLYVTNKDEDNNFSSVKKASLNRLNILEKSKGDFFCILDGDDYYIDKNFLSDSIAIFSSRKDVSIVAFGYQIVSDGKVKKTVTLGDKKYLEIDTHAYLRDYYVPAGACVYKKECSNERMLFLKKNGFFDDNNILINNLNYGTMVALNRPIYAYRQVNNSVYSRMDFVEKSVLNVQGLGIDLDLINKSFEKDLFIRNSYSLLVLFFFKNIITDYLDSEKINKYLTESKKDSLCYQLLTYRTQSKENKRKIIKIISWLIIKQPHTFCKIIISYFFRGSSK